MQAGCSELLDLQAIREFFTLEQYEQLEYLMLMREVNRDSARRPCLAVDCRGFLTSPGQDELSFTAQCNICASKYCFECGREPHEPQTCSDYEKQLEQDGLLSNDEIAMAHFLQIDKNIKRCPRCRVCFGFIVTI